MHRSSLMEIRYTEHTGAVNHVLLAVNWRRVVKFLAERHYGVNEYVNIVSVTNMSNIRETLLAALEQSKFFEVLADELRGKYGEHGFITEALVDLHNDGSFDLVKIFSTLEHGAEKGYNFFSIRMLFGEALPRLKASIASVMECVLYLMETVANDGASSQILSHYIAYCAADPKRPIEALGQVEKDINRFKVFLAPSLEAGSRIDLSRYVDTTIGYSKHENIDIRRLSLFALGEIDYQENTTEIEKAVATLEAACLSEIDDILLSKLIQSTFAFYEKESIIQKRSLKVTEKCLSKGGRISLQSAAYIFGFKRIKLSDDIISLFLKHFLEVKPEHKGTIEGLDFGLMRLLKKETGQQQVIEFIEKYLIAHRPKDFPELFDNLTRALLEDKELFGNVLTKWFLDGDIALCEAILYMLETTRLHEVELSVDPSFLKGIDSVFLVFLARKIVGYLIYKPITAASLLLSILPLTDDTDAIAGIANIFFDPLLINYPRTIEPYLKKWHDTSPATLSEVIKQLLEQLESYFNDLESAGKIMELHPYQSQREAYRRRSARQQEEIVKMAQEKSIFASIFSNVYLLYGKKAITYVHTTNGQTSREVIPMQHHSTELELPYTERFDPFGLDYILRSFRVERFKK